MQIFSIHLITYAHCIYITHDVNGDGSPGKATSYQNIHIQHFHAVPTYIKKEDKHLLEHPLPAGQTAVKFEIHHGDKQDPGYAYVSDDDDSHAFNDAPLDNPQHSEAEESAYQDAETSIQQQSLHQNSKPVLQHQHDSQAVIQQSPYEEQDSASYVPQLTQAQIHQQQYDYQDSGLQLQQLSAYQDSEGGAQENSQNINGNQHLYTDTKQHAVVDHTSFPVQDQTRYTPYQLREQNLDTFHHQPQEQGENNYPQQQTQFYFSNIQHEYHPVTEDASGTNQHQYQLVPQVNSQYLSSHHFGYPEKGLSQYKTNE